jgi:hypothetical protein
MQIQVCGRQFDLPALRSHNLRLAEFVPFSLFPFVFSGFLGVQFTLGTYLKQSIASEFPRTSLNRRGTSWSQITGCFLQTTTISERCCSSWRVFWIFFWISSTIGRRLWLENLVAMKHWCRTLKKIGDQGWVPSRRPKLKTATDIALELNDGHLLA